jgi:hypothetical protein
MSYQRPPERANGAVSRPHLLTIGPILNETPWSGKLTTARAHVAVVVVYSNGAHQVVWPHDRRRILLHKRPTTLYEIDLGIQHTAISADLPSSDHAEAFHASFSIEWRALDPAAVVRHKISDVYAVISAQLLRRARRIARRFEIDQAADAEDALNAQLDNPPIDATEPARFHQAMQEAIGRNCLGAEYGLWTRAIAELTLDDATIEHNTKMTKLTRAIKEEEAEQKLRLLQELNQQQIMKDRIAIYRDIVAAGDIERFALRLAHNPTDIDAIAAILHEEQLTNRRDTIDFVTHMVDSGVIERWEISDQAREALEWLKNATARVIHENDAQHQEIKQPSEEKRHGRADPADSSLQDASLDAIIASPDPPAVDAPPVQSRDTSKE